MESEPRSYMVADEKLFSIKFSCCTTTYRRWTRCHYPFDQASGVTRWNITTQYMVKPCSMSAVSPHHFQLCPKSDVHWHIFVGLFVHVEKQLVLVHPKMSNWSWKTPIFQVIKGLKCPPHTFMKNNTSTASVEAMKRMWTC